MSKYDAAVQDAVERLKSNARDSGHDLQHHHRVWKNCQDLLKKETVAVNTELLKIAVYWHDVVVGEEKWPSILMVQDTCAELKHVLTKLHFSEPEINVVIEAVLHHQFRDQPSNKEGLVLQDADKLETLSRDRWFHSLDAYKKGTLSHEKMTAYVQTFFTWIPILSATFHFKSSQKLADQLIAQMWADDDLKKIASELGMAAAYQQSKANMHTWKTRVMRTLIWLRNILTHTKIGIVYG